MFLFFLHSYHISVNLAMENAPWPRHTMKIDAVEELDVR